MATLGIWFFGVGMATLALDGATVRVLDTSIRSLALTRLLEFPLAVWVAIGALCLAWVFERFIRIGRNVYAIAAVVVEGTAIMGGAGGSAELYLGR